MNEVCQQELERCRRHGTQHGRTVTNPLGQPSGDRNAGEKLQGQQVVATELAQKMKHGLKDEVEE